MDLISKEAEKYVSKENVEIFRESWDEDSVNFEMDNLKRVKAQKVTGYGLRIIKDGKIGFTSGTSGDAENIVKRCLDTVKFSPDAAFEFPKSSKYGNVKIYDEAIASMTAESMAEKGREVLEYLKSKRPDLQFDVSLERNVLSKEIRSAGFDASCRRSVYSMSAVAYSFREGDFMIVGDGFACSLLKPMEFEIADNVLKILEYAKNESVMKTGIYPAVLSPKAFREILSAFLVGMNGRIIEKGSSPLGDKMGRKVLPDNMTIYDDGTIDGSHVSAPFDDEGLPVEKKVLIENGVLRSFLLDLDSAAGLKLPPTGNGQRDYANQPRPGAHAVVIPEGDLDEEDLIRSIDEGVYIDQLIGTHTGNPFSGDFQLSIDMGFKIEKGERVGRVKNMMMSGNSYKIVESISGMSKTRKWSGRCCLPSVRFDSVSLAG